MVGMCSLALPVGMISKDFVIYPVAIEDAGRCVIQYIFTLDNNE